MSGATDLEDLFGSAPVHVHRALEHMPGQLTDLSQPILHSLNFKATAGDRPII